MLVAALFLQGCGGAAGVDAGAGAAAPPATSTWCAIDGTDTGNGKRADEAYYKSLNATAANGTGTCTCKAGYPHPKFCVGISA